MTVQKTIKGVVLKDNELESTTKMIAKMQIDEDGEMLSLKYKDVYIAVDYAEIVKIVFEARNKI